MTTAAQSRFQGLRRQRHAKVEKRGAFSTIPVPGTGLRGSRYSTHALNPLLFLIFPKLSLNRNVAARRPRKPGHAMQSAIRGLINITM